MQPEPHAQSDAPGRRGRMLRLLLMAGCIAAAIPNGLTTSPIFDSMAYFVQPFIAPAKALGLPQLHVTGAMIMLITLMLGGVPAALYERLRGHQTSTPLSMLLWLAVTSLVGLPGIIGLIGLED